MVSHIIFTFIIPNCNGSKYFEADLTMLEHARRKTRYALTVKLHGSGKTSVCQQKWHEPYATLHTTCVHIVLQTNNTQKIIKMPKYAFCSLFNWRLRCWSFWMIQSSRTKRTIQYNNHKHTKCIRAQLLKIVIFLHILHILVVCSSKLLDSIHINLMYNQKIKMALKFPASIN